jgi:hypothetical protein
MLVEIVGIIGALVELIQRLAAQRLALVQQLDMVAVVLVVFLVVIQ